MNTDRFRLGALVTHPEWGPGKIVDVHGDLLRVYFRDLLEETRGEAVKRISLGSGFLALAEVRSDPWLDYLPPLKGERLALSRARWTIGQAIENFRRLYPLGFNDPGYLGGKRGGEQHQKRRAHELYLSTLGDGQGQQLLSAGEVGAVAKRGLAVVGAVNLLSPLEQMALRDGLKEKDAAREFFDALFDLLAAPRLERVRFGRYIEALQSLPAKEGKARVATWPILTILPFLANPVCFMFLKPEVTRRAAETLAFDLRYESRLNWPTYERLLIMSRLLMEDLRPLGAADWIDVQTFIWVTERKASGAGKK